MIPFFLFFYPPRLFEMYPVRQWRSITLWLKWGILFSLGGVMVHIAMLEDPADVSWIFGFLEYLARENDAITLGFFARFSLFFILESLVIIGTWLIKGLFIYLGYQILDPPFGEPNIAMSVAGGSMITNLWLIAPGIGPYAALLHSFILIAIVVHHINRTGPWTSAGLAAVPSFIPLLF